MKMQMGHILATTFLVSSCYTHVGAFPVSPRTAHQPQATKSSDTAIATDLSNKVSPPTPSSLSSDSDLGLTMLTGDQSITDSGEVPTATMLQPVGHPEKQQTQGDEGNTFDESSDMDVQIVTSYIAEKPDLSSTLTSTTSGDSALVGPSVGPGWSGNDVIDDLCICSPQPTSGLPQSAPVNRKRSASSSLMQHELRSGDNQDGDGQPACPTDDGPNPGPNPGNPGDNGPPGQGPGQKSTGIQPPPAVMQWIQSVLVTIQLAWITGSQVKNWGSWCIRRRKAGESDKPGDKQTANAEPDEKDEKAPADTSGDSKTSITDSQESECSGEVSWKESFSMLSKLVQLIGKGPQGPHCN